MAAVAPRHVLVVLVVAQFTGTSLWFAINAVLPELSAQFGWPEDAAGLLSASLQGGFIVGTLCFALTMLSDRFDPRHVFLIACMAGAVCTLVAWQMVRHYEWLVVWRFLTGVCLAGIYPVGMKIAAQWFPGGLGRALGWLVGALVVGSASAHGLRAVMGALPWDTLMLAVCTRGVGWVADPQLANAPAPAPANRLTTDPVRLVGILSDVDKSNGPKFCTWLLRPHVGALYVLGVVTVYSHDPCRGRCGFMVVVFCDGEWRCGLCGWGRRRKSLGKCAGRRRPTQHQRPMLFARASCPNSR